MNQPLKSLFHIYIQIYIDMHTYMQDPVLIFSVLADCWCPSTKWCYVILKISIPECVWKLLIQDHSCISQRPTVPPWHPRKYFPYPSTCIPAQTCITHCQQSVNLLMFSLDMFSILPQMRALNCRSLNFQCNPDSCWSHQVGLYQVIYSHF